MGNLVKEDMRLAINRAFNTEEETCLSKVSYVELDSANGKHNLEMMSCGSMGAIFAHITTDTDKAKDERKNVCFPIPNSSVDEMRMSWADSEMMSAGFYDGTCPEDNVKFELGKEYKTNPNDKIVLKIIDTQAEELEDFAYNNGIQVARLSLSLSSMKRYTKDMCDDKIVKAIEESKAAVKMSWLTHDNYRFAITSDTHSISFESYDDAAGIIVTINKRKNKYSLTETAEFNIPESSLTIFELYKFLKLGKGAFLFERGAFGDPKNRWVYIAQGTKDISVKYKDKYINTEEEDVDKFIMGDYEISELTIA